MTRRLQPSRVIDKVVTNNNKRYQQGVAIIATGIILGFTWEFATSRASDEDVKANAERIESHEKEANATITQLLINQGKIATSIDFLVKQQDPHREPIAPEIEEATPISELSP